ncbi:MAG: hypothetical protein OEZ47_16205, partial [Gammaproteobacteria bacterium]|nr:hypothetical protein [Gammaproteobacteria bacterium]
TTNLAPLWNRALSTETYTPYTSNTMDLTAGAPGNSSKLCLSCHDGTLAIGAVNVAGGKPIRIDVFHSPSGSSNPDFITYTGTGANIPLTGTDASGSLPESNTGFTANLGTDFSNDHPIGFVYDATTPNIGSDGELALPDGSIETHIAVPVSGRDALQHGGSVKHPSVPLGSLGDYLTNPAARSKTVECTTCHDPHLRASGDDQNINIKFLRLNRFQKAAPTNGAPNSFDINTDMNCLACHRKTGWANSSHARSEIANEIYDTTGANLREFPDGLQVWEAGCLNCHDTHTVAGAKYLLREATDSLSTPKAGGNPAQEETCYQCHTLNGGILLPSSEIADIETEFGKTFAMPISLGTEVHTAQNADLQETTTILGQGVPTNRHAECTDCHSPHRMISRPVGIGGDLSPDTTNKGKHHHSTPIPHTNVISGSLRGTFGVDTTANSLTFDPNEVLSYNEKFGDPGLNTITDSSAAYVTKEYQVCLKCHSNYVNALSNATSNPAMEFSPGAGEQGDATPNHRSWHPVKTATGRSGIVSANTFVTPYDLDVGNQTMYCSDCHTSESPTGPRGPHGSSSLDGLFAGNWNSSTGTTGSAASEAGGLCFTCHKATEYADSTNASPAQSGFSCVAGAGCNSAGFTTTTPENLHITHAAGGCQSCHVRRTHGWKTKGMIANKGDGTDDAYQNLYFDSTVAKIDSMTFRNSGNWNKADCTAAGCHL